MATRNSHYSLRPKRTRDTAAPSPRKRSKNSGFRFFDLPRELRDCVYAELRTKSRKISRKRRRDDHFAHCHLYMPLRNFQLVNRQFKKEYTEAILPQSILVVQGSNPAFNWKKYAKRVGSIIVYIKLSCGATPTGGCMNRHPEPKQIKDDDGTVPDHAFTCWGVEEAREWVATLHKLKAVFPLHDKLELRIGLDWKSDEDLAWPRHIHAPGLRHQLNALTEAMLTVSSVQVALFDCKVDYESWERSATGCSFSTTRGEREMDLWAKWTKDKGWQAGEAKGRRKFDEAGNTRELYEVIWKERVVYDF